MSFDHPEFLWLLLVLPLDLGLGLARLSGFVASRRSIAPPATKDRSAAALRRFGLAGVLASALLVAAASVALAGPTWGTRAERAERSGLEVALVLDVSRSMEARDAAGTRLDAAKSLARLIIAEGPGDAMSLSVAKGEGLLLVPMTEDLDAVESALDYADPSVMSRAGTDLGGGVMAALSSFSPIAGPGRLIVLLSDGGDQGGTARAAALEARSRGIRLVAVGFGGSEAVTVPGPDGRPLSGRGGLPLRVALEEELLRAMAQATGGRYFDAGQGSSLAGLRMELAGEGRAGTRIVLGLRDQSPLFIFIALGALMARLAALLLSTLGPRFLRVAGRNPR